LAVVCELFRAAPQFLADPSFVLVRDFFFTQGLIPFFSSLHACFLRGLRAHLFRSYPTFSVVFFFPRPGSVPETRPVPFPWAVRYCCAIKSRRNFPSLCNSLSQFERSEHISPFPRRAFVHRSRKAAIFFFFLQNCSRKVARAVRVPSAARSPSVPF